MRKISFMLHSTILRLVLPLILFHITTPYVLRINLIFFSDVNILIFGVFIAMLNNMLLDKWITHSYVLSSLLSFLFHSQALHSHLCVVIANDDVLWRFLWYQTSQGAQRLEDDDYSIWIEIAPHYSCIRRRWWWWISRKDEFKVQI